MGDLFRILLAVSMLIVAILVAFFVMKNLTGFSLPDLKQTLFSASVEESEMPVTIRVEESTKESPVKTHAETTATPTETETESSSEAESEKSSEEESKAREKETESVLQEERDPHEALRESRETVIAESPTRKEETVRETERDARYESPVMQEMETKSLGPGFAIIDQNGPVGAN